jgi:PleD family two-component response regulator
VDVVPSSEGEHQLRRLQPLRVLLSGRDRRFLRVTSFLLAQRGYDVQETSPRRTLESVERHRPDVVLLETNDSRTMAARKIAALQALSVAPSVLVVYDDEPEPWPGLLAVRKWTAIETLVEQIEAAALARPAPLTESERVYL